MPRTLLPARRQNLTLEAKHGDQVIVLCVGYYADGRPAEVFADGHKEGSAMQAIIDDSCIMISLAMQNGISVDEMLKSMSVQPAHHGGKAVESYASPIGAILDAIVNRPELAQMQPAK